MNRKASEHRLRLGSYAWCERESAHLSWRDRASLVGMLVRAQLRDLFEQSPLGRRERERAVSRLVDVDLGIPDSKMALEAEAYARTAYNEPLRLHCLRTFLWGTLLAATDGRAVDRELLYVASMLHDLGLGAEQAASLGTRCFATTGARVAERFVVERGWQAERAVRLYEAISLHLNPLVDPDRDGVEARYVADGATLDVIGARRHRLPPEVLAEVHRRAPREGFREEILRGMSVPHAPGSRPAFLLRLGFAKLAAACPLDHEHPAR